MIKKILSLTLVAIMVIGSSTTAFAAEKLSAPKVNTSQQEQQNMIAENNNKKIKELLAELGEIRAHKELILAKQEMGIESEHALTSSYNTNEQSIEEQLFKLGVTEVQQDELRRLTQNDPVPRIYIPPNTSTTRWYSYRHTMNYNGISYNIQELYAQGMNGNSSLSEGRDGVTLYSGGQLLVSGLKYIASMYAQKVIGLIPVVNWTPYELLFSDNSKVVNDSHVITYRSTSTVCFTYVRLSSQDDDYQNLSFVSNSISVAASHTLAGYDNGRPYAKSSPEENTTINADTYAPLLGAVQSYLESPLPKYSYASYYVFYNQDKTKSILQHVATPEFPGQVY